MDQTAARDGLIEAVGMIPGSGLLLQGWSRHLAPGPVDLDFGAAGVRPARIATYPRSDAGPETCGYLALIHPPTPAPDAVPALGFTVGDRRYRLDPYGRRQVLPALEAARLVARLLPRLASDAVTAKYLRRAACVPFTGADTVAALGVPVRAGVDAIVTLPDGAVALAGWLLDPQGWVEAVGLRSDQGPLVPLAPHWARQPRPDLAPLAGSDPAFARAGTGTAGFAAVLPAGTLALDRGVWHLELALVDGRVGGCPLDPDALPAGVAFDRLLTRMEAGGDPALLARLVPIAIAAAPAEPPLPPDVAAGRLLVGGPTVPAPAVSILVSVSNADQFDLILATLAPVLDAGDGEVVAAAAPGPAGDLQAVLRAWADLYRVPVRLVAPAGDQPGGLWNAAAAAAAADRFLFLSEAVVAGPAGWLASLRQALAAAGEAAAVSPTLLDEDGGLAFCGAVTPARSGPAPLAARYAGYPRALLDDLTGGAADHAPRPAAAISLDACLMSRRTFRHAGGIAPDYLTADAAAADFVLRLRRAGVACWWLPAPALQIARDPAEPRPGATALDRSRFRARWQDSLAGLTSLSPLAPAEEA